MTQYREVLRLAPDNMAAVNNLAELLATHPDDTVRDGAAAVQLAEDLALKTAHTNPVILDTLAAAYAESGRFAEAVQMAQRARQAATRAGNQDLARVISDRLYWYRQDLPYREAPGGTDRASSPAP
ncbi:hypothetical protein HQ590_01830 [bacterium]|nr:hypothetical protein [bacterium]